MYSIGVNRQAQRAIDRLPSTMYRRLQAAIDGLAHNPRPPGTTKLHDLNLWRIRVGEYRVISEIDDAAQTVTIVAVGHRRDVYR